MIWGCRESHPCSYLTHECEAVLAKLDGLPEYDVLVR